MLPNASNSINKEFCIWLLPQSASIHQLISDMLEFPVCFADSCLHGWLSTVSHFKAKSRLGSPSLPCPFQVTGEATSVLSSYMAFQHHDGKVAIHTPPDWKRYREYLNRIHF